MGAKEIPPKEVHQGFYRDIADVLRKYSDGLNGQELLAITAQIVGRTLALQDQTEITIEMASEVIRANIEKGNKDAIDELTRMFENDGVGNA